MKNENNNMTITVENGTDKKLQCTINKHSTIDEYVNLFKTILIWQTFTEDQVKDLFEAWENPDSVCEDCVLRKTYDSNAVECEKYLFSKNPW